MPILTIHTNIPKSKIPEDFLTTTCSLVAEILRKPVEFEELSLNDESNILEDVDEALKLQFSRQKLPDLPGKNVPSKIKTVSDYSGDEEDSSDEESEELSKKDILTKLRELCNKEENSQLKVDNHDCLQEVECSSVLLEFLKTPEQYENIIIKINNDGLNFSIYSENSGRNFNFQVTPSLVEAVATDLDQQPKKLTFTFNETFCNYLKETGFQEEDFDNSKPKQVSFAINEWTDSLENLLLKIFTETESLKDLESESIYSDNKDDVATDENSLTSVDMNNVQQMNITDENSTDSCLNSFPASLKYVVVHINPDQLISWGGTSDPCGYVELDSIGSLGTKENMAHSKKLFQHFSKTLGIASDRMYIKYVDLKREDIGYAGTTFAGL